MLHFETILKCFIGFFIIVLKKFLSRKNYISKEIKFFSKQETIQNPLPKNVWGITQKCYFFVKNIKSFRKKINELN